MKSHFQSKLDISLLSDKSDDIWVLNSPLEYYSELLKDVVIIPSTFQTDLASVPRVPIIFSFWGGTAHREGVLHDYLFRSNSIPVIKFNMANSVFLEAMKARKKPFYIRHPIYLGVCLGGYSSYHKKLVEDVF